MSWSIWRQCSNVFWRRPESIPRCRRKAATEGLDAEKVDRLGIRGRPGIHDHHGDCCHRLTAGSTPVRTPVCLPDSTGRLHSTTSSSLTPVTPQDHVFTRSSATARLNPIAAATVDLRSSAFSKSFPRQAVSDPIDRRYILPLRDNPTRIDSSSVFCE